jgi:hypothetical protein
MPVPDLIRDCSRSFTDLLLIAFNCIDKLLADDELFIGNSGHVTLDLIHRGEDF